MRSRYNLMKSSSDVDLVDLEAFPDPLSVDYSALVLSEAPYQYEVDDKLIEKPFVITNALYGVTELEDIVFDLNNIGHVQQLKLDQSQIVIFPVSADILSFFSKNRVR